MNRKQIRIIRQSIVLDLETRPYEFWRSVEFPWAYQMTVEGQALTVEIQRLAESDAYLRIGVTVSRPKWYSFLIGDWSLGTTFVVAKSQESPGARSQKPG